MFGDPLGRQAAVPDHHPMRRGQLRLHFGEHLDEPVDRVGRRAVRGIEVTDGMERPIGIGMPIYNQQLGRLARRRHGGIGARVPE